MDATELRAMQAPIKDRYKSDPGAALITLKAKGTLDDSNIACKVETGRAIAAAGLRNVRVLAGAVVLAARLGDHLKPAVADAVRELAEAVRVVLEVFVDPEV